MSAEPADNGPDPQIGYIHRPGGALVVDHLRNYPTHYGVLGLFLLSMLLVPVVGAVNTTGPNGVAPGSSTFAPIAEDTTVADDPESPPTTASLVIETPPASIAVQPTPPLLALPETPPPSVTASPPSPPPAPPTTSAPPTTQPPSEPEPEPEPSPIGLPELPLDS